MTELIQDADFSITIGYPSEDSSIAEIPEGIRLDNSPVQEKVEIFSFEQNKKIYERLVLSSQILKFYSIIDFLVCLLYMLSKSDVSGLLMAIPLFGYCGAKYFHRGLVSIYGIYLSINILIELYRIFTDQSLNAIAKNSISCLLSLSALVTIVFFYSQLNRITKIERRILRIVYNLN